MLLGPTRRIPGLYLEKQFLVLTFPSLRRNVCVEVDIIAKTWAGQWPAQLSKMKVMYFLIM